MEAARRSGAELLLRALPLVIMAAVAASYVIVAPGPGFLALLSLGPAFAALSAGLRNTVAMGIVALVLCAALSLMHAHLGSQRNIVAFVTIGGVTAAGLTATEVRRRREQELADVRAIADAAQRVLLRPVPPQAGPARLAVRYLSAASGARIGGDLYEVVPSAGGIRAIIGDVQGKGLAAVKLTETVLGCFRECAFDAPSLTALAGRLEASLARDLTDEQFVTAVLAETDWNSAALTLLNCGHPPPLLLGAGPPRYLEPARPGLPLGLGGLADAGREPGTVGFGQGEAVLFYTDGVSEARGKSGEFFPLEQRCEGINPHDTETAVERLTASVLAHVGHPLDDDAAMLLIARNLLPG